MIDTNKLTRQIKKEVAKMKTPSRRMMPYTQDTYTEWMKLNDESDSVKAKVEKAQTEIYSSNFEADSLEMRVMSQELFLLKIQHYKVLKRTFECVACLRRNIPEAGIMDEQTFTSFSDLVISEFWSIYSEYHMSWCEDEECNFNFCRTSRSPRPDSPRYPPSPLPYFRFERDEDPVDEDPC